MSAEQMDRLRAELARVKMAHDILVTATAYFANAQSLMQAFINGHSCV